MVRSTSELVGLALALGATGEGTVAASPVAKRVVQEARRAIARGEDPLGEAFCALRSKVERRPMGATYTPDAIVAAMVACGAKGTPGAEPVRVVDPGSGSGRFIVAAGRALPGAELIAVEIDPLAVLLTRAHLAAAGLASRARVLLTDYRTLPLAPARGPTLFLGNPPYVRHHGIAGRWKQWLTTRARTLGFTASQLAGLHIHFLLATALHAREGDRGVFVTSAEWLDVGYGSLARQLLLGPLGASGLHLVEPTALPFADADTTAAITCFTVGARPASITFRRVASLADIAPLEGGHAVARERLEQSARWTPLSARARKTKRAEGLVELGELCHVHRGQVTGANAIWIAGAHSRDLPRELQFASITRARELFAAGRELRDEASLRQVIDLPLELDLLGAEQRRAVDRFLKRARAMGGDRGFVAQHRRAWWSVGLRAPAPILATYMARRPPAFVRNLAGARHINIAHGLYPREPMPSAALDALAAYLATAVTTDEGRTYAGGLTKFEPREMERLLVPAPT